MPCHAMPCHAMSCHAMPCHAMPCHATPRHALSCLVLSCLVLSCLVLSCLVLSCLVLSCLVLSCLVLSCLVLSCLVLSCHVSDAPDHPDNGLIIRINYTSSTYEYSHRVLCTDVKMLWAYIWPWSGNLNPAPALCEKRPRSKVKRISWTTTLTITDCGFSTAIRGYAFRNCLRIILLSIFYSLWYDQWLLMTYWSRLTGAGRDCAISSPITRDIHSVSRWPDVGAALAQACLSTRQTRDFDHEVGLMLVHRHRRWTNNKPTSWSKSRVCRQCALISAKFIYLLKNIFSIQ